MQPLGPVIVNGKPVDGASATIHVADVALLRGYGCFEAIRSYGGRPFRLNDHLDRLESSAKALGIPLPDRDALTRWAEQAAAVGDAIVRIVVTGGHDLESLGEGGSVVVLAHTVPARIDTYRLLPLAAPWHPAGRETELAGAKTLSYAPNAAAFLRAKSHGFDDALLVTEDDTVLELPTATVAWVHDGTVETPALSLGILRSITRGAMLEVAAAAGIPAVDGTYRLDRLEAAAEVFVMSTTREIAPVVAVGDRPREPGPVTARLGAGLRALIAAEVGS